VQRVLVAVVAVGREVQLLVLVREVQSVGRVLIVVVALKKFSSLPPTFCIVHGKRIVSFRIVSYRIVSL
jgi:hypothetical protein